MYHRVLIDNRADCALELIEACHTLGIEAFVVSARDDVSREISSRADEVFFTGMSRDAYMAEDNILETARHCACEALMPGWGFLSEDFQFARRCRHLGIHFIGPTSRQLQLFGDKLKTIQWLGPVLGQKHLAVACDDSDLYQRIQSIPAPYMLKPRFGGGGKNILRLENRQDLSEKLSVLKKANQTASYMVEHAVDSKCAHHLEFQVMGDGRGHVSLIGARDCTPQINHQKWLECSIDLNHRLDIFRLGQVLCEFLARLRYKSWGTVECLVDDRGHVQLLELNPRLQVEHLVTVFDSHYDLISAAFQCECAGVLPQFVMPSLEGAVEFRLYARGTGCLESFVVPRAPSNGRMFSAYSAGDVVSGVYDGMLARFVVCGRDALTVLKKWMSGVEIAGVKTNMQDLQVFGGFRDIPEIVFSA